MNKRKHCGYTSSSIFFRLQTEISVSYFLYKIVLGAQIYVYVCDWSTKNAEQKNAVKTKQVEKKKKKQDSNIPKIAGLYVQLTWISEHTNVYYKHARFSLCLSI